MEENNPQKSMLVAYVIWFFLGGLGGHRFYLGKMRSGLVMLGVCVLNVMCLFLFHASLMIVLWVWLLVDAFLIPGYVRSFSYSVP